MERTKNRMICAILLGFWVAPFSMAWGKTWPLAQFGATQATSKLPHEGWNTILHHAQNVQFTTSRNRQVHGLAARPELPREQRFGTFMGVAGEVPIVLRRGHKIQATFYNDTDQKLRLQARISFTDGDEPGEHGDKNKPWFTMYSENETHDDFVAPGGFRTLVYNISDATSVTAPGQSVSEGTWSLVNVSVDPHWNAWHGAFILTDLSYSDEADIFPPPTPRNAGWHAVQATVSDTRATTVELFWDRDEDVVIKGKPGATSGINRYLIYRDGNLHGVVRPEWVAHYGAKIRYRDLSAIPQATHTYHVYAVDAAVTGHYRVPSSQAHFGNESAQPAEIKVQVPAFESNTLINPHDDLKFMGAFRLPRDYEKLENKPHEPRLNKSPTGIERHSRLQVQPATWMWMGIAQSLPIPMGFWSIAG